MYRHVVLTFSRRKIRPTEIYIWHKPERWYGPRQMRIPHALFHLINVAMVVLLRSPLHSLFSSSILAIRYTGVRSGRTLTVPARYHRSGDDIVLVTSEESKWWPNFIQSSEANVLLEGAWVASLVHAIPNNPNLAGPIMREIWAKHPSDSAYMNVRMRNGVPDPEDIEQALKTVIVITINRVA